MTSQQKLGMYAAIEKHGKDLLKLFPNAKIKDPIALCKTLHRLEIKANRAATDYCNTGEQSAHDLGEALTDKAAAILGVSAENGISVFFNGDARGYALKIGGINNRDLSSFNDNIRIYKDWGGYGIVAPDFTPQTEVK